MIQELINDLHYINSMGETPDGDGITVNVQLWAERWITRLEADPTLRDAERYRWLLRNYLSFDVCDEARKCGNLDAAIDAAMKGANA